MVFDTVNFIFAKIVNCDSTDTIGDTTVQLSEVDLKRHEKKKICVNWQQWWKLAKKKCGKTSLPPCLHTETTKMVSPMPDKRILRILCWIFGIHGNE